MSSFGQYLYIFPADTVSNNLDGHPLQLDSGSSSASKKATRESDNTSGGTGSHGTCLSLNDHDHIRQFIQEFTSRGLLSHIEKNIRQLNDQVS